MPLHSMERDLRQRAAEYRRRALAARGQALSMTSAVAQSSLLTAAQTWDRLADAREIEANMIRARGDSAQQW